MNQKNVILFFALGAGAIAAIGYFGRRAVTAVANVNQGTPYEGFGPVGTAGNVANTVSVGTLARIGSAIGEFFSGPFFDRRTVDDLTRQPQASPTPPNMAGGGAFYW